MKFFKNNLKVLLIVIFSTSFLLRIINIDQSLWLDEASQLKMSSSVYSIWFERGGDFHPPLFYVFTYLWLQISNHEIWLRMLPIMFGVLTVVGVYLLSKSLFNQKVGLISAFLMAINPYHIYYSQEIRMYAAATFFAVYSMYFFHSLIKEKRLSFQSGYVLTTAALIYTHYLGLFLIAAQVAYLISSKKLSILYFKQWAFIFLLYLPWLPQFLKQLQTGGSIDTFLPGWREVLAISSLKALPLTVLKFSIGRIDFENTVLYVTIAFFVLAITGIISLVGVKALTKDNRLLLSFWFLVPFVLAAVISFQYPLLQPFRLLFILPSFLILVAYGIIQFGKFQLFAGIAVASIFIFGLILYYTNPQYWREDWRSASQFVSAQLNNETVAVFAWNEPFDTHVWYAGNEFSYGVVKDFPAAKDQVYEMMKSLESKEKIFYFEYLQELSDPDRYIFDWFENNGYQKIQTHDFRGVGFIDLYQRDTNQDEI